ncbi:telomere-associated protein RIF1 isoform X1 [Neodiprion lecontei]|uniref:Telomere-associated protein RIF1 isoform X1 n=1 Tax=Neodiprion lecontei TaxID=441921 RepID=A0ABM3G9U4_NEOLC|nr:telomere-associated protein RIF1 isoform X1 [Neodiprion lecontei]
MSSSRSEFRRSQVFTAVRTLRGSLDPQEICEALTCIQSAVARPGAVDSLSEGQLKEICKLVLSAFTSGKEILYPEASCTLAAILRSCRDRKLNLFSELMRVNFEARLKIFQLFEGLQDEAVKALSSDKYIVDFLKDCMNSVTAEKMDWIAPDACVDNIKPLQIVEYKTLSTMEQVEEKIVVCVLNLLYRLYKLSTSTTYDECAKFSGMFLDKVATLAYMGHKRQRGPAIQVLQVPNMGNRIRISSPTVWQDYKTMLQNTYCKRMSILVSACEPDWSVLWTTSIQLLGTELHRGAGLINNLLSVEEKAFKSVDTVVRRQAFLSWNLIVDNFALDEQELATVRRIKLLCIPLNAKNSKTEMMTMTKLTVWWHLIYKLFKHIEKFTSPVLTQFLNFCFGPLGDTPLLSSKFNVVPSPGKRFYKTKFIAIDALLQLLSANEKDLELTKSSLEEKLPSPVSAEVFKLCYKTFVHCVGEAMLALTHMELETRGEIIAVFWKTLLARTKDIEDGAALSQIHKEIILLFMALGEYIETKPIIRDTMLDIIIPSLESLPAYIFNFDTMVDLMTIFIKPSMLSKIDRTHHDLIKYLLWRGVKPSEQISYVPNAFEVIKKLVEQLESVNTIPENSNGLFVLWCILCEMVIKYMNDGKEVNEGDAAAHDFKTIQTLMKFPFTRNLVTDVRNIKKIAVTWKNLYGQFDLQANLVSTVKPNEFVSLAISMIQDGIDSDERYAGFAVSCLDGILTTMNYKHVLDTNGFLPIVRLINNLCIINFRVKNFKDTEVALRELSSVLITLYGHAPSKVATCLEAVRPALEHMLGPCKEESLVKEIMSTWETIMSIFKGLGAILSSTMIVSFQKAFQLALRHQEFEIVSQTLSCLDLDEYRNKPLVKKLINDAKSDKVKQESTGLTLPENGDKQTPKFPKQTGSFLNRKIPSPKPITPGPGPSHISKNAAKCPYFPDPDSQEYVVIKNDFKFDANRLTEHQKESLLRRREDIPALYNDLSQSYSQDTQKIQEWFDKEKSKIANQDTTCKLNSTNALGAGDKNTNIGEANKENKLDPGQTVVTETSETSSKVQTKEVEGEKIKNGENIKITENPSTCERISPTIESSKDVETNLLIAKKLNFESLTEFPKEASSEKKSIETPSTLQNPNTSEEKSKHVKEATKRGVKRKTTGSDSDSEGNICISRKLRKSILPIVSDTQSDSDSIQSTESEKDKKPLSKRTKTEMSRLRINMVFGNDQFLNHPGRRRSKVNYEDEGEAKTDECESCETSKTTRNSKTIRAKGTVKEIKSDPGSQSSQKRKLRNSKSSALDEMSTEKKTVEKKTMEKNTVEKKTMEKNIVEKKTVEKKSEKKLEKKLVDSPSSEDSTNPVSHENTTKKNLSDKSESKDSNEIQELAKEPDLNITENESQESASQNLTSDSEEIVESSQASSTSGSSMLDKKYSNKQCFIRINKMQSLQPGQTIELDVGNEKTKIIKGPEPDSPFKVCTSETTEVSLREVCSSVSENNIDAEKMEEEKEEKENTALQNIKEIDDTTTTPEIIVLTEPVVTAEAKTTSPELRPSLATDVSLSPIRLPSSLLSSCSPKTCQKRYSKLRTVTPQGRTAHMLGLVTKQALAETKSSVSLDEDLASSSKKVKENEEEPAAGKKDRFFVLKEPERLGSPSGSRQEKIFNKMRTTPDKDALSQTMTNHFGNLRNDGEKSSLVKIIDMEHTSTDGTLIDRTGDSNREKTDEENNASLAQDREALPILEWSSANPPSLTASPSASILKRQRQLQIENDAESPTVACKRKRVSFADPPVSKEMGYEITTSTSPHRMSKLSSGSRIFVPRKDSPIRLKQTKIKTFQSSGQFDKEQEMEVDKSLNPTDSQVIDGILNEGKCSSKTEADSDNLTVTSQETQNQTLGIVNNSNNQISLSERGNDSARVTLDNLTMEIEIAAGSPKSKFKTKDAKDIMEQDVNVLEKQNIEETETQQDIFEIVNTAPVIDKCKSLPKRDQKTSPTLGNKTSQDDSSLRYIEMNVPTNPTIQECLTRKESSCIDDLEDTVDIQNVTGLNSTTNSEELFASKPVRTSTHANDAGQSAEFDTLPVTDSVFSNLPFSQSSQVTNDTMELDQPELLDSACPIFPTLIESSEPIDSIVGYLADPLWKSHLSNYFQTKGIETVGNLAQLSEREVNWIPVKRSPKVPFVKSVLEHFEKTAVVSLPSLGTMDNTSQSSVGITPTTSPDLSLTSSTPIAQSSSLCPPLVKLKVRNSMNDCVTCPKKLTKSTETQVSIEELLDEVDASVTLKSAIKRCSAENIIANYRLKMKNMADEDLERATIKMLGIQPKTSVDAHLKTACRASGLEKVLGRLPDIFSHDKNFFTKLLGAYRRKIQAADCMQALDFEEIKTAINKRCTSSDLAELLSRKLKEEADAGITTPMTELSSLQAMLKRMPKDLIISHTVANEELISPLIVLDIALQNNSPADICSALEGQPSTVRNRIFSELCTIQALATHIEEKNLSDDALTELLKVVAKNLDTTRLLDVFNETLKEKFTQLKPPSNT